MKAHYACFVMLFLQFQVYNKYKDVQRSGKISILSSKWKIVILMVRYESKIIAQMCSSSVFVVDEDSDEEAESPEAKSPRRLVSTLLSRTSLAVVSWHCKCFGISW